MPTNPTGRDELVERVARAISAEIMVAVRQHKIDLCSDDESQDEFEALTLVPMIRAALTTIEASRNDGWQPIETAPRDGSRVLLWIIPTEIAMPFEWQGGRWMGDDFPLNMAWPTHWMPLPEPPSALSHQKGDDHD